MIDEAKARLRTQAKARRRALAADKATATLAATAAAHHFLDLLDTLALPLDAVIALYWPLNHELDPRPLAERLLKAGRPLALPAVLGPEQALAFHAWAPGQALCADRYGIMTPLAAAPLVRPRVIVVPLLAFDAGGVRLGYGGGYYDRTLKALRHDGGPRVSAIGFAFAGQQVARLPHHAGDERLDAVATNHSVRCYRHQEEKRA